MDDVGWGLGVGVEGGGACEVVVGMMFGAGAEVFESLQKGRAVFFGAARGATHGTARGLPINLHSRQSRAIALEDEGDTFLKQ